MKLSKWHRGAQKRLLGQGGEKAIQSVHINDLQDEEEDEEGRGSDSGNSTGDWVAVERETEGEQSGSDAGGVDVFACDKCGREFMDYTAAEKHERHCTVSLNQHSLRFDPTLGKSGRCNVLSKAGRPCPQPKSCCPYHSDMVTDAIR